MHTVKVVKTIVLVTFIATTSSASAGQFSPKYRAALEASARAHASESKAWSAYVDRIDRIDKRIRTLDTAAKAATRSSNPAIRAGGSAYRLGRAVGSGIVAGRDKRRH